MKIFNKIKTWYINLPEKKKYIEFFSALLTLPMLVTVIMINVNNLNNNKKSSIEPTLTATPEPTKQIIAVNNATPSAQPTVSPSPIACKNQIGSVEISSPDSDEVITKDPVTIDISYNDKGIYCPIVWSYRLDGNEWSEFSNKSISLYNLSPGNKKLEVKVKNINANNEVLLKKNFYYEVNSITPTTTPAEIPTATPTSTNSAVHVQ
jgi:hypothetical protein